MDKHKSSSKLTSKMEAYIIRKQTTGKSINRMQANVMQKALKWVNECKEDAAELAIEEKHTCKQLEQKYKSKTCRLYNALNETGLCRGMSQSNAVFQQCAWCKLFYGNMGE